MIKQDKVAAADYHDYMVWLESNPVIPAGESTVQFFNKMRREGQRRLEEYE